MPKEHRYSITEEEAGLLIELKGPINASLLIQANKELLEHPAYSRKQYQLWDFTDCTHLDLDSESIRQLAMQDTTGARMNPDMIVLLVGPSHMINGVSKIYNLYSQVWEAFTSHAFSDRKQAQAWIESNIEV
jgi:hypothetical protein